MSLADHARAALIMAASLNNRAKMMGDPSGILTMLADAYADAADTMATECRMEAEQARIDHGCTIDHRGLPAGRKCPACGAPRG